MGQLLKPKGLKGEFKAKIFNRFGNSLKVGVVVWLENRKNKYLKHTIERISQTEKYSYVKLVECCSRENAEELSGLLIYLNRENFELIDQNEHYLVDLIGCSVLDQNFNLLGITVDVWNLPSQNLLVIKEGEKEFFIPYVDAHVKFFDKDKRHLIVKNIEGLIP